MNQPWGRNSIKINPIDLLKELSPVIGTGDWDDDQCRNFTDEKGTGMKIGDVVLVRDGKDPIALCKICSENFKDPVLESKYKNQNYRKVKVLAFNNEYSDDLLNIVLKKYNKSYIQASGTLTRCVNSNATKDFIKEWYESYNKKEKMQSLKKMLQYKKQIILQGPPGTGKTRLAKQIANNFIGFGDITDVDINNFIKVGSYIQSVKGSTKYLVKDNIGSKIILKRSNGSLGETSFDKIIQYYKEKRWNEEITDNDKRRAAAIAKFIFDEKTSNEEDQIKLVQFHPSYTYEDFVRGIVAESKGVNIEYKNVNKTLGLFAEKALKNYLDSKKEVAVISNEKWLDDNFNLFVEKMAEDLNDDNVFKLTKNVNIVDLDANAFLYIGKSWKGSEHRMLFKDIKQAFLDGNQTRKDLSHNINISGSARQHATYYVLILQSFLDFVKDKPFTENSEDEVNEKSYVLIIDEINRANLSSVLGELIYALEYRGEEVESMYEVDGSQKLILPPNLYIIGTLNTADRSVGHIDYAIRRRFAFVDVLPEELNDNKLVFQKELFKKVSALFINNYEAYIADKNTKLERAKTLSAEFRPEDVWLGHSYFIQTKEKDKDGKEILVPEEFNIRLEYEIKPILLEYVKDGILIGKVEDVEIETYIKYLIK